MIRGLISPVKPKAIAVFSKETTFAPTCFAWLGKKKLTSELTLPWVCPKFKKEKNVESTVHPSEQAFKNVR